MAETYPFLYQKVLNFKRYISLSLITLCMSFAAAAQGLDSLKRAALSEKLDEYFTAIMHEPLDVQKEECDFLIESAADSSVRQYVALKIYDHYLSSPLMGAESVALHVLDEWFFSEKVKMKSDIDLINARVFADFNRQSMPGCKAPQISMQDLDGQEVSLFGDEGSSVELTDGGRISVLYFYDTDCVRCRAESILLRSVLEENDFPIDFYAIYTGDNRERWEEYVASNLAYEVSETTVTHLWDPELDSDFQRKYGVLQTPRMFLITPDGTIAGRGLDSAALLTMLLDRFRKVDLNYGGDESVRLFDGILQHDASSERVCRLADYISEATLSKGDFVMYRQLTGDLLYYLSTHSGEGMKIGLEYLIDRNISGKGEIWNTPDDSLKVIGFAAVMKDLLSKSPVGSRVADVKVPGEFLRGNRVRNGSYNLMKLRGDRNLILFYTEGCEICKEQKALARSIARTEPGTKVLLVNVDEILASSPALADRLFDLFDLSSLPFIIETDSKGLILRRYIQLL